MSEKLTDDVLIVKLASLKHWLITEIDGSRAIYKEFRTDNFVEAMNIANHVSELAEENDHHPQITVKWGSCTVYWWTHDVGGVSDKDINLARLCEIGVYQSHG